MNHLVILLSIGISYLVSPNPCSRFRDCLGPKPLRLSSIKSAALISAFCVR